MADRHLVISLENIDHTLVAPVKHVPPHPLYPPVVNASHSSEVSSNEQALCRLIETDGRSFFSAVIQPDLAPCYILSPVELAGPDDERKQELITEITDHLQEYRLDIANFAPTDQTLFKLQSYSNQILLTCDEKAGFEVYGLFAISPTRKALRDILTALRVANKVWAAAAKQNPAARRLLDYSTGIFDAERIEWAVVVLRHSVYLFDGQLKGIKVPDPSNPSLYVNKAVYCTGSPHQSWLKFSDDDSPWNSFRRSSTREPHEKVSVFAMIFNALAKVTVAAKQSDANDIHGYLIMLRAAVWEIMFVPNGFQPPDASDNDKAILSRASSYSLPPSESVPWQAGVGSHPASASQWIESQNGNYLDPEAPPETPESPPSNGLTLPELEALVSRLRSDDVGQRMDALSHLFGPVIQPPSFIGTEDFDLPMDEEEEEKE